MTALSVAQSPVVHIQSRKLTSLITQVAALVEARQEMERQKKAERSRQLLGRCADNLPV